MFNLNNPGFLEPTAKKQISLRVGKTVVGDERIGREAGRAALVAFTGACFWTRNWNERSKSGGEKDREEEGNDEDNVERSSSARAPSARRSRSALAL